MRKRNVFICPRKIGKDGMIVHHPGMIVDPIAHQLNCDAKMTGDRQLTVGKPGRAFGMMTMSVVGDGRTGRRHEPMV